MSENEKQWWHGGRSRQIVSRIVIEGQMQLQTPTSLGGGESSDLTDMPLLVDLRDGKSPLLTGASLAGALRSYLRSQEMGYLAPAPHDEDAYKSKAERQKAKEREWQTAAQTLFGGEYAEYDKTAQTREEHIILMDQSSVIIDDALGTAPAVEQRFGVKLNPATRTAADDTLFDTQLWPAGTIFPLRLQLIIREGDDAALLKQALAAALAGLSNQAITLGGRKRRGYGAVHVAEWLVQSYDLTTRSGLLNWLEQGDTSLADQEVAPVADIYQAMATSAWQDNKQHHFDLKATFILDGSLLIRTANSQGEQVADFVHLHSRQVNGQNVPILSGTSLTGALRARALKITNTLDKSDQAKTFVYSMFGPDMDDTEWARTQKQQKVKPRASRLLVKETVIQPNTVVTDLVQNRVSIDRFTGGARDTALFNEQPVWGKPETRITIDLHLINPMICEIGLLLLLLKDLWTGDLPLGGESSVGRGRLRGKETTLTYHYPGEEPIQWMIRDVDNRPEIEGSRDVLEGCVGWLNAYLQEVAHG
jgi:CRISPR/Cas system CSM-associated protein Csm3 (group 7 of RAMP superfamily)